MANVVKKHSISSELAQKMVDQAVAKATELGVTENVAILDDGGNLKAFGRMDGAPILCIEIAQNKAYTALFGVSTQEHEAMEAFKKTSPPAWRKRAKLAAKLLVEPHDHAGPPADDPIDRQDRAVLHKAADPI